MNDPTFVFIICSAAGRVGRTTLARLFADYFTLCGRSFIGFDTNPYEPDFQGRFPKTVQTVDLSSVRGQMALLDPLLINDEVPKIIDLWHHGVDHFFKLSDHTGFVMEARRNGVVPIPIFFSESSQHSNALAWRIAARHPNNTFITVENDAALVQGITDQDRPVHFPPYRSLNMGRLDPFLRPTIDAQSFSFSRFLLAPPLGMSIVLRACLKSWILRLFAQFESLETDVALEPSE